jgi:chaperonin GroEL
MGKRLEFDDAARQALRRGVDALAGAVRVTLGPRGRNVVLEHGTRVPTITDDGLTIAREIELADPFENLGVQMVREAAVQTGEIAGDGTTTATVLAHAIVSRGLQAIAAGHNPMGLRRGIERATEAVVAHLGEATRRVESRDDVLHVASVSARGDAHVAALVADAFDHVGRDGVVQVEQGRGLETTLEVVEGVRLPTGWLSPYFVSVPDRMEAVLDRPLVLLAGRRCEDARDFVPALEIAARLQRPLFVVAEDVEGEALATLVVNRLRGTVSSAAVRAPFSGDRRRALLEDLAVLTGARLVADDLGRSLDRVSEDDLGRARQVVAERDVVTLIEGGGSAGEVRVHLETLERALAQAERERERESLRERLARLHERLAVLRVGGATETGIAETCERVEDALAATRAALEEGLVTGGGVALLRARDAVLALPAPASEDEQRGRDIVLEALEEPARQIAANAGADPGVVLETLRGAPPGYGYDAVAGVFRDLDAAGVVDPAKVVRVAFEHAAGVGALVLTTDAIVVDAPGEEPPAEEP